MLVSTEPGGLGNRIKSWVSAARLDPAARVYWPRTQNMPAAFTDLFENDCHAEQIPADATGHCSWQLVVLDEDIAELPEGFAAVVSSISPLQRRVERAWSQLRGRPDNRFRYVITPKRFSRRIAGSDGRVIDFEYERIPEYFRRIYRPRFDSISVRQDIRERIDTWARNHLEPQTVGVQIRTWRDAPRRHRKLFRPAVNRLRRLLEDAGTDRQFFAVSDDDDAIDWLRRECGAGNVLAFPRNTARQSSWESAEGMSEDLIDMLLLARCSSMFASYLSTFSETAWWFGGARAKVSVF